MALFGAVRRVMPMQHAVIIISFVVTIVPTVFLIALLLSGHLVRLVAHRGSSSGESRRPQKSWKLRRVPSVGSRF